MQLFSSLSIVLLVSTVVSQRSGDSLDRSDDKLPISEAKNRVDTFNHSSARIGFGTRANDQTVEKNRHVRSVVDIQKKDRPFKPKIVGGTDVKLGEIPWQASVKNVALKIHWCGAVIINRDWLLSAAHCFYGRPSSRWQITVGELRLDHKDPGQQTFNVDRIFMHPDFNHTSLDFDFALIKIKRTKRSHGIKFNKYARAIRLPAPALTVNVGENLVVSGWGYTAPCSQCNQGVTSNVLKKVAAPLVSQIKCNDFYPGEITSRMFCAGNTMGGSGSCYGDSGGPITYQTKGRFVLYGIVSWGEGCAQPNYPGVYARVTAVLPWITGTIQAHSGKTRRFHSKQA